MNMTGKVTANVSNITGLNIALWEQIITAVLFELIAIVGIIGNSMVILAVSFSLKLQTATNAFVTSLAVADLVTCFFYLVGDGIATLGNESWPIPQVYWLCKLSAFMYFACIGASLYTLGAIAINRLIRITRPTWYQEMFTSWKLCLLVAIPWIIPTSATTVVLVTGNGAVGYDKQLRQCSWLDSHEKAEVAEQVEVIVGFPLPFLAIVVSYIWIYVHVKKHFRSQKQTLPLVSNISREVVTSEIGQRSISRVTVEDSDLATTSACFRKEALT